MAKKIPEDVTSSLVNAVGAWKHKVAETVKNCVTISPYLLHMQRSSIGISVRIGESRAIANASYPDISSIFKGKNQIVDARLKNVDHQI